VEGLMRQLHSVGSMEPLRFDTSTWQQAIDSVHIYPFVTVIEKRSSPLNSLEAPKHGTQWQPFYDDPQGDVSTAGLGREIPNRPAQPPQSHRPGR
jgi:hypothetical protein